jgi:hypothetical protein
VSRSFNGDGQLTLMPGAGSSLAARADFAIFGYKAA